MSYTKIVWKDFPSTDTPVNAENLNKMDTGIYNNDAAIAALTTVVNQSRIVKISAGGERGYDNAYYIVQKALDDGDYLVSVEDVNEAKFLIETVAKQVLTGETVDNVENVTQAVFNTWLKTRVAALEAARNKIYYKALTTNKSSTMYLRRHEKTVQITHKSVLTLTNNGTEYLFATLPSGYRPVGEMYFYSHMVTNGSINGSARWHLTTDGKLNVLHNQANNQREYNFCHTFLTNDDFPSES